MHGTCVPLSFAHTRLRNVVGLRSQAGALLSNYSDALSLQQRNPIQRMTLIFCVWNFATVRRLHCPRANWNGLRDSSEWLYQTTSNSSVTSLKRRSSQRSVTNSHVWAHDVELNEDSKNDVLNCLNPVLLRLHNALVVRSHMQVVIVNLFHWLRSKKPPQRFRTNSFSYKNECRTVYLKQGNELSKQRVMVGWAQLLRTTCP